MMRRLVERHRGILPLDTAESIWRVIIATFTYVQAPFSVHADLSAGDAPMRDTARFHFGFTVPFMPHMGAASVVAAVAASTGDLGLVPAFATVAQAHGGPRSRATTLRKSSPACRSSSAPTIRPRLQRVRDRAAEPGCHGDRCRILERARRRLGPGGARALVRPAEVVAVPDRGFRRRGVAGLGADRRQLAAVTAALVKAGASVRSTALVGSHATRYTVTAAGPARPDARAPLPLPAGERR